MAKASPHIRSFNAGEHSELLRGRVDLEKHSSSLRLMKNYLASPQGPALSRSGTRFVVPAVKNSAPSVIRPFVYSEDDALVLEFSDDRMRVLTEEGLLVYDEVQTNVTSVEGASLEITIAGTNWGAGDQVILDGLDNALNLNKTVANVTSAVGDVFTLDVMHPVGMPVTVSTYLVYDLSTAFSLQERKTLRFIQQLNVVYILNEAGRMRKLTRRSSYDWVIEEFLPKDGPYLRKVQEENVLTPSGTGGLLGTASATESSGDRPLVDGTGNNGTESDVKYLGRTIDYLLGASDKDNAFDADEETYWAGDATQKGYVGATFAVAVTVDGYTIFSSRDNQDGTYLNKDYAPSSWTFSGSNGGAWTVLDVVEDYVLYDNSKSVFFTISNTTAYTQYRLTIRKLVTNGLIEPRVQALSMRAKPVSIFNLTSVNTDDINFGSGFLVTDIDRLLRIKGSDGTWRECRIDAVISTTEVTVELKGEPLVNTLPIREWRLGVWSDTTGWPAVGTFFEDRLYLGGNITHPDTLAMSANGNYDTFSPTDSFGVVEDANGAVFTLNADRLSRIRWMTADKRGVMMGTGSKEYTIRSSDGPLTARTAKAVPATARGSAAVEPIQIDDSTLMLQRTARTLRDFKYIFEADGYRAPSLSQLASHFGAVPFDQMVYASEPYSTVWIRRTDGMLLGFTYLPDENVTGWHQHDLSGAKVLSMATVPELGQQNDVLWCVVERVIDGQTVQYIEFLTRTWDFDMTLDDAFFVDCGVMYAGEETDYVYGLKHLEGEEVYGMSNGIPFGPITVEDSVIKLPSLSTKVVVGLGFESIAETSSLQNGAADGTAVGKVKRMHNISVSVWDTAGGELGVWNDAYGEVEWNGIEYPETGSEDVVAVELYTGDVGPNITPGGYGKRGSVWFRRPKSSPLPMNVVGLMPQLNTQDR